MGIEGVDVKTLGGTALKLAAAPVDEGAMWIDGHDAFVNKKARAREAEVDPSRWEDCTKPGVPPMPTLRRSWRNGPRKVLRMNRTALRWQRPRRLLSSQSGNPQRASSIAVHCIATRSNALF